jgi:hypothetical protein
MIPRLPGWSWEARADSIVLGAPGCAVRYVPLLRPLERLGDLLLRHTAASYAGTEIVGAPAELVTHEGEYAALVELDARLNGEPVRRALGFVFLDDGYAYVGGLAPRAHGERLTQAVRELVLGSVHQRGVRRRRFRHQPPRDWQGLLLGELTAHYFPPQHPKVPSRLTVYPAIPVDANVVPLVDLQRMFGEDLVVTQAGPPSGFAVTAEEAPVPVVTPSGLSGTRWRVSGHWPGQAALERDIVLLRDDRFAYACELVAAVADFADGQARLDELVRTIEPIPRPGRAHENAGRQFSYLAE